MDFVKQQYWDDAYAHIRYYIANDAVTRWLDEAVFNQHYTSLGSVFEFGCFPGRYLAHLGLKGLEINGMDLTPSIKENRFQEWLQSINIKIGKIAMGDVLQYAATSSDRYDMVCSFGFIEHFKNFLELVLLHDQLIQPGGLVVITTPNFRGYVQMKLHRFIDFENLKRHYLPSMHPEKWASVLIEKGYKIHYCGYFGGFDFWHDNPSLKTAQRLSLKVVNKLKPALNTLPSTAFHSPFCGLIAQKSM